MISVLILAKIDRILFLILTYCCVVAGIDLVRPQASQLPPLYGGAIFINLGPTEAFPSLVAPFAL